MLYLVSLLTIVNYFMLTTNGGGVVVSSTDWSELSDSLDGYIVLPTDDTYETVYPSWTATYDSIKPEAVAFCQSESDVQNVMKFIRSHAAEDGSVMNFAARSGKHNLAGWSVSDGLVIDLSGLSQLYVSDSGTAIVGPGVCLSVFTKFAEENNFTLPHGDCASVCFGGFLLGGGFGLISRTFGMGADWVKSINIVLPTGDLVTASDDDENYSDLFWALRGAGGNNFGIVTQYEMNIPEKKQKNPGLYLEISWDYDVELWSKIASVWNSFAEDTSYENHFAVYLRITPVTYITKSYYIQLHGFWTGEQVDGLMVVAKLLDQISSTPSEAKIDYVSFEGWIESSSSTRLRYSSHCSSRFAFDSLSTEFFTSVSDSLQQLIDYDNYADPNNEDELTYGVPTEFLFIAPAGGAITNHASDETAFPWRDATYLFVVCARYMSDYENAYNFVEDWITSTMSTMETYLSDKSFINFPDNNLANWQASYFGDNYARLQTIKAKYDPDNVFNFQFSIEPAENEIATDITKDVKSKTNVQDKLNGASNNEKNANKKTVIEKSESSVKTPVWIYVVVTLASFLAIVITWKLLSKCLTQKSTNYEYVHVNQQVPSYNTI